MVHKRYFGENMHIKDIFIRIIIHISIYQYMYIKSRKGCRIKIQKSKQDSDEANIESVIDLV